MFFFYRSSGCAGCCARNGINGAEMTAYWDWDRGWLLLCGACGIKLMADVPLHRIMFQHEDTCAACSLEELPF